MKKKIYSFIKKYSFYVYSSAFLLIWMTFFDGANLKTQFDIWKQLQSNELQISFYNQELLKVKKQKVEILQNKDALEKYGREKYLMKKEGETVFVLVDKEGKLLEHVE